MPKVDGLTKKQTLFVQGIAQGKTNSQAALDAYDTDSERVASVIAAENLAKPSIKYAVENAIGHHKITAEEAVAPVRMALDYVGDNDRETMDYRLKGLYAYLKLAQFIEPDKNNSGGNTIIFNYNRKTSKYVDPS